MNVLVLDLLKYLEIEMPSFAPRDYKRKYDQKEVDRLSIFILKIIEKEV